MQTIHLNDVSAGNGWNFAQFDLLKPNGEIEKDVGYDASVAWNQQGNEIEIDMLPDPDSKTFEAMQGTFGRSDAGDRQLNLQWAFSVNDDDYDGSCTFHTD